MNFQTQIPLTKQKHNQISYQSNLLLLGSCFSENIGNKLDYYKFQSKQNPFGILFHPKAIENLIIKALNKEKYTDKDVFFHNERWHTFEAHSSLSAINKNELLNSLNLSIQQTFEQLLNTTHLIITLGTAWVYREITSDTIVANCHKVAQKKFLKELLSVDEISESLKAINSLVKSVNKNISVIYTVSPVRHLKDGFIENQRSKAHLLLAIHEVVEPRSAIYYFPSYEIMMDELRDYRFYNEDMIHPNQTAINYIWKKFKEVWIAEGSYQTMQQVDTIQRGLNHKPFNPNSEAHQLFLKKLQQKKETLLQAFPFINF
ncbi:GSCFA domain-containing protein [Tenacibaculum discolor]|uniref:GSCFA domain-containing protein n=1 Tax=Tenacibaculum discolor TaxID=361581 RepID=A0A2G1BS47_9FLAO|nr:GSCFA domain-containing protein [Tenacibaculum discolor]MDP2542352.1 GSCFA domain-containing protein [Tenacibaculum discolor]PHN96890.1 GSCFA domain-containing protein [Tenacibaculum discolor]